MGAVQRKSTVHDQGRTGLMRWAGIGLILAVGVIHLITAPDQFNDAIYKGLLFLANAVGAVVVAAGLWKSQGWAWMLGLILAVATAGGYVLSRTLGLPGLPIDPDVFEPLGVAAVVCEVAFAVLAIRALTARSPQTFDRHQEERAVAA
jgi:hypothetical protein